MAICQMASKVKGGTINKRRVNSMQINIKISQLNLKLIGLSLFLIVATLVTGCAGGESYKDYIHAADKTDEIKKGAQKIQIDVVNTFDLEILENATEAERKLFSTLEQVELSITSYFDYELNQSLNSIYYLYQGLGTDIKIYQKSQDEIYLKLPFDGNYYEINENSSEVASEQVDFKSLFLKVGSDWNNMLEAENIFIGEKSIITSEAGDIKTTKFTVKPTSTQLNDFMLLLKEHILSDSDMLIKYLGKFMGEDTLDQSNYEAFVNALLDSMTITRFEEIAFVDIDGYVVDEQIEIEIEYNTSNQFTSVLKNQKIVIKSSHWDIEKNQDLDFSELNQDKIIPIEQLEKGSVTP